MFHSRLRNLYGMNVVILGSSLRYTSELSLPWGNTYDSWLTFPSAGTAVPSGYSGSSATQQGVSSNGISSFDQANVTTSQAGTLTSGYVLGGTVSVGVAGQMSLTLLVGLNGPLSASALADGGLELKLPLTGDLSSALTQIGSASLGYALDGALGALLDGTAALNYGANLTGSLTATMTDGAPPLILLLSASGNADGTFSVTSALQIMGVLSGAATASVTQTGAADLPSLLSGSAYGITFASLDLHGLLFLSGTTAAQEYQQIASAAAQAVWTWAIEGGLDAEQVLRILLSVAAGKRDVVDLGGGIKQVTFRGADAVTPRVDGKLNTTTGARYDITTNGA